jgi:peptidoglycan-N-acetylglucosamine deacetylase
MKTLILLALGLLSVIPAGAQQRSVAITIDDVPNVHLYKADGYSSRLLKRLDTLDIPVAIFINEANLVQTSALDRNKQLLKSWLTKDFITAGNHSYSHPNYGEIGFEAFKEEVTKGEVLTKAYLKGTGKKLEYFRFPFNAMGKDSAQHVQMRDFLRTKNYISTPFTVENEDWLYTQVYEKALKEGQREQAAEIGRRYIEYTLRRFDFFDSLSIAKYGKPVPQIYLCHDNRLNTDFLPELIQKLKEKEYRMVSLAAAMKDPVYQSRDYYFGNAGFSWLYRWMSDLDQRRAAMRKEPEDAATHKAFEDMQKK